MLAQPRRSAWPGGRPRCEDHRRLVKPLDARLLPLVPVDVVALPHEALGHALGFFGRHLRSSYPEVSLVRVQTNTTATYAVGDPWLLKAALPPRFSLDATYAAAPATWDTTYRFVGGNSTEPLQFGNGDRGGDFLGQPKVEWPTMATGSTTGTKLIVAGYFPD